MKQVINDTISYIEEHIKDNLSVESISLEFGYSKHHFSRMFKQQMGLSLQNYIIDQKLTGAAKEILGNGKIIDIATDYGYETQTGFLKAFKKKFGYPPTLLAMVKTTEIIFKSEGGCVMTHEELYTELSNEISGRTDGKQNELINKAYLFAVQVHKDKKRHSGEDYVTHPLHVALILSKIGAPIESIILGIIHDCCEEDPDVTVKEVKKEFGDYYFQKMLKIKELNISSNLLSEVDIEMEENVVLVKLADRLHNMKTLKYTNKLKWRSRAEETINIFSPLAEKLGNTEIKAELDKLAIQVLSDDR